MTPALTFKQQQGMLQAEEVRLLREEIATLNITLETEREACQEGRNRHELYVADLLRELIALRKNMTAAHKQANINLELRREAERDRDTARASLVSTRAEIWNIHRRVDLGQRENALMLVGLAVTSIDKTLTALPAEVSHRSVKKERPRG